MEEVSQTIDITDFVLYDDGVFVIWKWKWGENVYETPDSLFSVQQASLSCKDSPVTSSASEDEPEAVEGITHSWYLNVLDQIRMQTAKKFCVK